jgi:pimeloyl-ACP methyl ester carboxylesterase
MVLVDPSMPGMGVPPQAARARACVTALQAPAAPTDPGVQTSAPVADAGLLARCRGKDPDAALARWTSRLSELESLADAADLDVQPAGSLGFPLIVLTAGRSFPDPAMTAAWHARHAALAALSARGSARLVEDSGHMMMFDRPDAIVRAVADIARR